MQPVHDSAVLSIRSTLADAARIVRQDPDAALIPIVKDMESYTLIGEVSASEIEKALGHFTSQDQVMHEPLMFFVEEGVESELFASIQDVATRLKRKELAGRRSSCRPCTICHIHCDAFAKVDLLFRTLKLTSIYVHQNGRLEGIISRQNLVFLAQDRTTRFRGQ